VERKTLEILWNVPLARDSAAYVVISMKEICSILRSQKITVDVHFTM
jgi:hypothetical protein